MDRASISVSSRGLHEARLTPFPRSINLGATSSAGNAARRGRSFGAIQVQVGFYGVLFASRDVDVH